MESLVRDGVIVVDKPAGWTSHDAVGKMRRIAKTKRIGHLGTLDPAATGVLPLLVGRVTRLAQFYGQSEKVYDAIVRFGFATDTYDAEGTPTTDVVEDPGITAEQIEDELPHFRGVIEQIPPPVSAKKVNGVPAYKLARRNTPVALPPVEVEISELTLQSAEGAEARLLVRCSTGTYVRAIAHDLGRRLGCGAHLKWLRRLQSGEFTIEQAHTIEQLQELAGAGRLDEALVPAAQLLPAFPAEYVDAVTAGFIRQGRDFRVSPFRVKSGTRYVKAITQQGELVAIGEAILPNLYHPAIVL
jgi:tRNA pseudouridine55 synthase